MKKTKALKRPWRRVDNKRTKVNPIHTNRRKKEEPAN